VMSSSRSNDSKLRSCFDAKNGESRCETLNIVRHRLQLDATGNQN
jgi:hypothetical protein